MLYQTRRSANEVATPCARRTLSQLGGGGFLFSGETTEEDILSDYPDLEPDDLRAALAFAARLARSQRLNSLPTG